MFHSIKRIAILSTITLISSVFSFAQNIQFTSTELYPEGVVYSESQEVFFVSSLHYGKIGTVDKNGVYSEFVNSPDLVSAIGLSLNDKTNTLYVCVSDPGVSVKTLPEKQRKLAKLIAYDTKTRKKIFSKDLGALNPKGFNFANDITYDNFGNVYVTNSFAPFIYKIAADGTTSIFATSELWKGEGFNLNGIVLHPDGYLIVAKSNSGELFKVSTKNPVDIQKINGAVFPGADGLIYNKIANELVVISNAKKEIYQVKSQDNWATSTIVKTVKSENSFPTTGTIVGDKYYVLNAKLDELFNPTAPKSASFLLQEVKF